MRNAIENNILDTPTIQPFQMDLEGNGSIPKSVNLFRGDVTFSISLASLQGRNGLDVSLGALYLSNVNTVATHTNLTDPTGILGLGWSMPIDKIIVDPNGSGARDDDVFYVVRNNTANRLYRTARVWQRGMLDASLSSDLNGGQMTPTVINAFLNQGLPVSGSSILSVVTQSQSWNLVDDTNQYVLSVVSQSGGLAIFDAGIPYELADFGFERIRYYSDLECWAITTPDGLTTVFGSAVSIDSHGVKSSVGNCIQWGVRWNNWIGPSTVTHDPNDPSMRIQQQYPKAWNHSRSYSAWGDEVTFSYNQTLQNVGSDGLPYTKACYLDSITDVFGRVVTLVYGDKQFSTADTSSPREYLDPYKATPSDTPDAYQSTYETKFLASIAVADQTGTPLYDVEFDYDLRNFSTFPAGSPPALVGSSMKRVLVQMNKVFPDGSSLPPVKFDYCAAADNNPGALLSMVYAEGGTVTYTYSRKELSTCTRSLVVQNPFSGGEPRIWFGPDYAVMAWYDSQGKLQITPYTWVGRWQAWTMTPAVLQTFVDMDDLHVEVANDFFVLYFGTGNQQGSQIWPFHRDDLTLGGWIVPGDAPITIEGVSREVALGTNFFALNDRIANTVTRYTWDLLKRQWTSDVPASLCGSNPPYHHQFFITASNNILITLCYDIDSAPKSKNNVLRLDYLDETGAWQIGDSQPAPEISIAGQKPEDGFTWSPETWVMAATFVTSDQQAQILYSLCLYMWEISGPSAYKFRPVETRNYSLAKSEPSGSLPFRYDATILPTGLAATGPHLLRFNGAVWLENNNLDLQCTVQDGNLFWFAFGPDCAVKTENSPDLILGQVQIFDPNTQTVAWQESAITLYQNPPATESRLTRYFPTTAPSYLSWDTNVYSRGTSTDWISRLTGTPLYTIPSNVDTTTIINESPEFFSFLLTSGSEIQGAELCVFCDGQVTDTEQIDEAFFRLVRQDGTYETDFEGKLPAGPGSFVTYKPLDKDFSEAASLTLYRFLNDSITAPIVDFPVSSVQIDDGFGNTGYSSVVEYSYTFDEQTAACDRTGEVAKYFHSAVEAGASGGSDYGRMEYFFINGLPQGQSNPSLPSAFDGLTERTVAYDSSGTVVAQSSTDWGQPYQSVQDPYTGEITAIYGLYIRPNSTTSTQDGVSIQTSYTYDLSSGQQASEQQESFDARGKSRITQVNPIYAFTEYTALWYANALTDLAGQTSTVSVDGAIPIVTNVRASTFQPANRVKAGELPAVWAPFEAFVWMGGDGSSAFDYQAWSSGTTPPPAGWKQISRINLYAARGSILERESPIGIANSTLYDVHEGLQVASFSRARVSKQECFYYGFEEYETTQGWSIDQSQTPIVADTSNTGLRCLRIPPAAAGSPLTLTPEDPSKTYIFSFWAKTETGFGQGQQAGWRLAVGTSSDVVGIGPSDEWTYYFKLVTLPADQTPVVLTPFNSASADIFIDDVSFCDFFGQFGATIYLDPYHTEIASIGPFNAVQRTIFDHLQRAVAVTGQFQNVVRIVAPHLSRQANDTFEATDPNRQVHIQPMGQTYYDRFRNNGEWSANWTSDHPEQWSSSNGSLIHGTSSSGAITLASPSFTSNYCLSVQVTASDGITQPLGLNVGFAFAIYWDPSTEKWTLKDDSAGETLYAPFTGQPGSHWVLALTLNAVIFLSDGRLAFCYYPQTMPSGNPQLFAGDVISFAEFLAGGAPQVAAQFFDGCSKQRQSQSIEGAAYVVTETVYDELGRAAVTTKPASYLATSGNPLVYRQTFVKSMDWNHGTMTGDVANSFPDDDGFPYSRQVYENSPLGRVIESGAPGSDFAITSLDRTDASQHTIKTSYGCNVAGGFPSDMNLPAGKYFTVTQIDQDGNQTIVVTTSDSQPVANGVLLDPSGPTWVTTSSLLDDLSTGYVTTEFLPNYHMPPDPNFKDSWQRVTTFDMLGRKISSSDPDVGAAQFIYDENGQLRFFQDAALAASGTVAYAKYDAVSRISEEGVFSYTWDSTALQDYADNAPSWPGSAQQPTVDRSYFYDGDCTELNQLGTLTSVVVSPGTLTSTQISFEYDNALNLKQQTTEVHIAGSGVEYTTSYEYDNLGNACRITYPSGFSVSAIRDDAGRVTTMIDGDNKTLANYEYTASDQLLTEVLAPATSSESITTYSYNSPGWLTSIQTPLWAESLWYTSNGYGGAGYYSGRIASFRSVFSSATSGDFPSDLAYKLEYDRLGRVSIAQCLKGGTEVPDWSIGLTRPTEYDANGNFTVVDSGGPLEQYTYKGGTDFAINTNGSTTQSYTPDVELAVKAAQPANIVDIEYDLYSRLPVKIETADEGTIMLVYDAQRRRVQKQSGTSLRVYLRNSQGLPLAEEFSQDGNPSVATEYLYGPGGLLAIRQDEQTFQVLRDHLHSIHGLVNDGNLASGIQYLAFGSVATPVFGSANVPRYLFTGYEMDEETGLYNAAARLYDPGLRRFYSCDPEQQFASPYVYAGNNPVNLVDPTGRSSWWASLIGGILGGIVTLATGGLGALAFGGGLAASAGTALTAGVTGAVSGDAISAGIGHERFTGKRALLDVVAGAAGGVAGALVGGAAGKGAMSLAYSAGMNSVKGVTALGIASSLVVGGTAALFASAGAAAAVSGQHFSLGSPLNIAIGTIAGFGGALMGSGAHFGFLGAMPVEIGPAEFGQLNPVARMETTRGLVTFVTAAERANTLNAYPAPNRMANLLTAAGVPVSGDLIASHGIGRYLLPFTTRGYKRPMSVQNFAAYLRSPFFAPPPGGIGLNLAAAPGAPLPVLKLSVCFAALPPGRYGGSLGQTLATALGRDVDAGRLAVYPTAFTNRWIRFTP